METVKVDIKKLQLLNDRISQCMDALNQVRLSTHGLSHTGIPQNVPLPGYPLPQTLPGIGINPYIQPFQPFAPAFIPGLSHTTMPFNIPATPFIPGLTPPVPPAFPVIPFAGLSHTGPEMLEWYNRPLWTDPLLAVRVAQTFPYAQAPIPPVMSIF